MRSDVVFKTVNTNVSLIDDGLFSSFQGLPLSTSLYRSDITVMVDWAKSTGLLTDLLPRFSPPGDRWCDLLWLCARSSSTVQVFRDASHQ